MKEKSFYYQLTFVAVFTLSVDCQLHQERINRLELERDKLRRQIDEAIEEGVRALRLANDTDAHEGIEALRTLGSQVRASGHAVGAAPDVLRRSRKKKHGPDEIDEIFKYGSYDKKKIEPKKAKLMLDNRILLDKKLKDWMEKRIKEKQRLKEYLEKKRNNLLAHAVERCPQFGLGNKRNKDKKSKREKKGRELDSSGEHSTQRDAVDDAREARQGKRKYPCCRSCCQKSYLGCL